MGQKDLKKRKQKPKTSPSSSKNGTEATGVNASEFLKPRVLDKGEAISITRGGKKKSSFVRQKNTKR